jgi:predicted ATPase
MNEQTYISDVELSGYKSILDLKCSFKPGLNIIIGDNGSGKSNFFEIIHKCFTKNYRGFEDFRGNIVVRNRKGIPEIVLSWTAENIDLNEIPNPGERLERTEQKMDEPVDFSLIPAYASIGFAIPDYIGMLGEESNFTYKLGSNSLQANEGFLLLPNFIGVALTYIFPSIYLKDKDQLQSESIYQQLFEFFELIGAGFKHAAIQYSPIEDIRLSNAFRLAKMSPDTYELRNIILEYKINGDWFSWNALSDGTKRVIYLISEIIEIDITMLPDRERGLIYPLVLLEEPELGVHPHQLHLLLQFLRDQALRQQIILTTHSPQVLDMLSQDELDRIVIAEISPEKGTTFRHLTEDEFSNAKLYMSDTGLLSDYWRFSDFQRSR